MLGGPRIRSRSARAARGGTINSHDRVGLVQEAPCRHRRRDRHRRPSSFVDALRDHPRFEIGVLAASERSAGRTYGEAWRRPKTGALRWWCTGAPPPHVLDIPVIAGVHLDPDSVDLVFSAVESDVRPRASSRSGRRPSRREHRLAFRYEDDVPLLIPGVNLDHAPLLHAQRKRRGWRGFVRADSELHHDRARDRPQAPARALRRRAGRE